MRNYFVKSITDSPLTGYVAAIFLVALALVTRLLLKSTLGLANVYHTFYLAVIVASLFRGLLPGITATVLSVLAAVYFLMEPVGSFQIHTSADFFGVVVFVINSFIISFTTDLMLANRSRALKAEAELTTAAERRKAAEAALNLAAIVESSDDAITGITLDGAIESWNLGAERIYGYAAEEMMGRHISSLVPPGHTDDTRSLADRIERGERLDNYETVRMRKDGSRIDVSLTVSPIRGDDGGIRGASVIARDVTERRKAEALIRLNEDRLETLLKLSQLKVNSEKDITDYALEEAVRLTMSKGGYFHFFNEEDQTLQLNSWSKEVLKVCRAAKAGHYPIDAAGVWADSVRLRKAVIHNDYQGLDSKKGYPEGHFHLARHLSVPIFDGDRVVGVTGVGNKDAPYNETDALQLTLLMKSMWGILKQKRMAAKLEFLAVTDDLTGLANRRHFNTVLDEEIRRACRRNYYLALMMIDVDFFKRYNDLYGHVAGDHCLMAIAAVLQEMCKRAGQVAARFGGEEFAIIMPGSPPEEALIFAEKLRQAVMERNIRHEDSEAAQVVTISVGIVTAVVSFPETFEWFIKEADKALYQSKATGRNRVTVMVS